MEKENAAAVQRDGRPWARRLLEIPDVSSRREGMLYVIGMLFMTGVMTYCWFDSDVGPDHPVYALMVVVWAFGLTPGVVPPVLGRLPRLYWFRVPAGERVLHRMLGVGIFGWLLERSGYNRHVVRHLREFDGTKAGLPSLALSLRGSAASHGIVFAIHVLLAAVALFTGHPKGALWILLPGVVIHLYPVLLQRSVMLRVQPLLEKCSSSNVE